MVPALTGSGYLVVPSFIDQRLAQILYKMLLIRQWRGENRRDDQVPEACSYWGDSTLDALLVGLLADFERAVGARLLPTYSYARLYVQGNVLPRHRDREACEVAASIHLGSTGGQCPPMCLAPDVAVHQQPGDAVIYLGDRVDHWREAFHGATFGQLFLNFVLADGERSHHVFDGRRDVFPPQLTQVSE